MTTAENLIEKSHLIPMRDILHGKISAVIPDNDIRFLFWDINLQKWIDDKWYMEEVQDAHDAATKGAEVFADMMKDKLGDALLAEGLSGSVSTATALGAKIQAQDAADACYDALINKIDPQHEAVDESADADWDYDVSLTVGDATISPGEWGNIPDFIDAVNDAGGFDHATYIFDAGIIASWPLSSISGSGQVSLSIIIGLSYQDGSVDFNNGSGALVLYYKW